MGMPELVIGFMEEVQEKGVAFSLDDFGRRGRPRSAIFGISTSTSSRSTVNSCGASPKARITAR